MCACACAWCALTRAAPAIRKPQLESQMSERSAKQLEELREELESKHEAAREARAQHTAELRTAHEARDEAARRADSLEARLAEAHEAKGNLQMELSRSAKAAAAGDGSGGGGSAGGGEVGGEGGEEVARLRRELEGAKEELRKSQEEQLGASLRARRKEKELKEQIKKLGGA